MEGEDPNAIVDPAAAEQQTGPAQIGDQGVEADPADLKKAEF